MTAARRAPSKPRVTAETLAAKQRDISVSEFFAKNRHLLGFDNPRKALLTTVKEAVDNSLDACEEAGILPEISVVIEDLSEGAPPRAGVGDPGKAPGAERRGTPSARYRVTIADNGPGIVRKQIENIFGRLLYGSKFHRLKMSRGQQGIGISAAGMYGLMTTGKPMVIVTRPKEGKPAHHIELAMDTTKNRPEVTVDVETEDFPEHTGTRVAIELEARYTKGRTSVDEYLEQTAIANPHAMFTYTPPAKAAGDDEPTLLSEPAAPAEGIAAVSPDRGQDGSSRDPAATPPNIPTATTTTISGTTIYPRTVDSLPTEPKEIKPHPYGVELGTLLQMLKQTEQPTLFQFLQEEFCRISARVASELCGKVGLTSRSRVVQADHAVAEKLFKAIKEAKILPPQTDCLSPIGVRQILAGLLKGVRAEFYAASTREPAVYRGNPFQIEVGIAFGGELGSFGDENGDSAKGEPPQARVIRFANRVPLLYQQSACSAFKAVLETAWRNYGISQPKGSQPQAPMVVMIHMASVWVPFTSESKEAIADYDEIRKEMRLALQECGRKLGTYLRKRKAMRREGERRDVFERYIGEIAKAVSAINGTEAARLYEALLAQAQKRTAAADQVLDDEGKVVKEEESLAGEEDGVIVVGPRESPVGPPVHLGEDGGAGATEGTKRQTDRGTREGKGRADPFTQSKAEAAALNVAALARERDDEESQPRLLDGDTGTTRPAKRRSRPSARASATPSKAAKPAATEARPQRTPAASTARSSLPAPGSRGARKAEGAGKPKPKMRLVNGRLVPVQDSQTPGLF